MQLKPLLCYVFFQWFILSLSILFPDMAEVQAISSNDFNRNNLELRLLSFVVPQEDGTVALTDLGTLEIEATLSVAFSIHAEVDHSEGSNLVSASFTVTEEFPSAFQSDDYCRGQLDPVCIYIDPLQDGNLELTGPGTSDAFLRAVGAEWA